MFLCICYIYYFA